MIVITTRLGGTAGDRVTREAEDDRAMRAVVEEIEMTVDEEVETSSSWTDREAPLRLTLFL
jgi:hypothetical protein